MTEEKPVYTTEKKPVYLGDRHARFIQKQKSVLDWIAKFNYSTPSILARLLEVETRGQYPFFRKLENDGLIRLVRQYITRQKVYMLTKGGVDLLAIYKAGEPIKYRSDASRFSASQIIHNLAVQAQCLATREQASRLDDWELQAIIPEHAINGLPKKGDKRPDAMLTLLDKRNNKTHQMAQEIELTYKSPDRIYRSFSAYEPLMEQGIFSQVAWYFPTEAMCDHYESLFNEPEWPVFSSDRHGWKKMETITMKRPKMNFRFSPSAILQDFTETGGLKWEKL